MKRSSIPKFDKSVTDDAIYSYLEALDCSSSLQVSILFRYKEYDQIANLSIDPKDFNNPESFRSSYLAVNFLSKNSFLKVTNNPKEDALKKFFDSELKCQVTNRRFRFLEKFPSQDLDMVFRVQDKIRLILGDRPDIEALADLSSWGPGASTLIKSKDASSFKKFRDERGITKEAAFICPLLKIAYPVLPDRLFCFETGDRVVVVPKTSKIDRVILIQPGWNLWFQKGIGKLIRRRLLVNGLRLNDSDSINRQFCKIGSKTGFYSTVDFSSASDQISYNLVETLLPPLWFKLLDVFRCKKSADGLHTWNKFSSMGNGYTFELETLIFYALSLCVLERENIIDVVSVFGDDIIIPTSAFNSFHHFSEVFGFSFNQKKSFSSGYFRESCGSHYFDGVDCKPIFLRKRITVIHDLYKLYNQIRLLAHRCNFAYGCDRRFQKVCAYLSNLCPKPFRFRISLGYGEVGFVSNFDESTPSKLKHGHQGFSFKALISKPIRFDTDEFELLLVRLTEHSDVSRQNSVEVKSRTSLSFKRLRCLEWYDLGPWL